MNASTSTNTSIVKEVFIISKTTYPVMNDVLIGNFFHSISIEFVIGFGIK